MIIQQTFNSLHPYRRRTKLSGSNSLHPMLESCTVVITRNPTIRQWYAAFGYIMPFKTYCACVLKVTMTRSCCAFGCSNRDTKENISKGIKFYRIPVAKEKWLRAINHKDFDPPPDACICSAHFVGGTCIIIRP